MSFPLALIFADKWIGLGWITLLYGCVLCLVDGSPPEPLLARIDGTLLLFFSGLFIVVAGFNATGVPQMAWDVVAPVINMETGLGVTVFTVVVLIGSNLVSNVPLVLLVSPKIVAMTGLNAVLGWALLAWVSTIAGEKRRGEGFEGRCWRGCPRLQVGKGELFEGALLAWVSKISGGKRGEGYE